MKKYAWEIIQEQMETLEKIVFETPRVSNKKESSVVADNSSPMKLLEQRKYTMEQTTSQIDVILEKKLDEITAEEVKIIEGYASEAAFHDCDDPMEHCGICWRAMRINNTLKKIYYKDEQTELEIENALLAK